MLLIIQHLFIILKKIKTVICILSILTKIATNITVLSTSKSAATNTVIAANNLALTNKHKL